MPFRNNQNVIIRRIAILPVAFIAMSWFIDFISKTKFNPEITLGELSAIIITLSMFSIGWLAKLYLSHPFAMDLYLEGYDFVGKRTPLKLFEIGKADRDFFTICIRMRRQMILEEINVRFVEKRWFSEKYCAWEFLKPMWWRFVDVPENNVSIDNLREPKIEESKELTGRTFHTKDDQRGGLTGYYVPQYSCPRGDYLWFEVTPNLSIEQWEGYISFRHERGGQRRKYVRKHIKGIK